MQTGWWWSPSSRRRRASGFARWRLEHSPMRSCCARSEVTTMAEAGYILCALTSLFCAALLIRGYRAQRTRLLLWSSRCFIGLALRNAILVDDLILLPQVDLA